MRRLGRNIFYRSSLAFNVRIKYYRSVKIITKFLKNDNGNATRTKLYLNEAGAD